MSKNNNLFRELESVIAGFTTSVGNAKDDLANVVEKAEADAKARRLIESLDNQRITDRTRLRLIIQMDKLCERQELSDETKERVLEKMKEAEQRIDLSKLTQNEKEEFLARMMKVGRPIEISVNAPPQSFDRSSSSSGWSSDGSISTQGSKNSKESTAGVVKQLGKEPGDNGPLASPPKADKIGKGGEDKKAPTQSPGCGAGIKKTFSSCCTFFSNGLSSFTKLFSKAPECKF